MCGGMDVLTEDNRLQTFRDGQYLSRPTNGGPSTVAGPKLGGQTDRASGSANKGLPCPAWGENVQQRLCPDA